MIRDPKKDQIVDAALACFLARGYNGTSLDSIVKASGVSKGGIYWHFKSKEDMLQYLVEKNLDELKDRFEVRLSPNDSAIEKLYKFMDFVLESMQTPLALLIYECMTTAKDKNVLNHIFDIFDNYSATSPGIAIIKEGIESGCFRPVDPKDASETLENLFYGFMMNWQLRQRDFSTFRHKVKTALDIYLKGLLNQ